MLQCARSWLCRCQPQLYNAIPNERVTVIPPLHAISLFLGTLMAVHKIMLLFWLNSSCNSTQVYLVTFTKPGAVCSDIRNKTISEGNLS